MLKNSISLIAGVIFAIGLVVSGMISPQKVRGFLDIFGDWDPALLFVMGGAVIFNLFSFWYLLKQKPLCETSHSLPQRKDIDRSLLLGNAIFGIGWGILGICPGPGLVNLATLRTEAIVFVAAMVVGMLAYKLIPQK